MRPILQVGTADCAAACLAMILSAHGKLRSFEECRVACAATRDGVDAQHLVRAADRFGLHARAFAASAQAALQLPPPTVAYWRGHHFVVVERIDRRVHIIDPAVGRRRISHDTFADEFLGAVVTFEQSAEAVERPRRTPPVWGAYLASSLSAARTALLCLVLTSIAVQLAALSLPVLTAAVVNEIVDPTELDVLNLLFIGAAALAAVQFAGGLFRSIALARVQRRLDAALMDRFIRHLMSLPLSYFAQRASSDLAERAGGTSVIRELVGGQSMTCLLDSVFAVVYLGLLLTADPLTGCLALLLAGVQVMVIVASHRRGRVMMNEHLLAQSRAQTILLDSLHGIGFVKATGAEETVFAHWRERFDAALDTAHRRVSFTGRTEALHAAVRFTGPLLFLAVGAQRAADGELNLGTMLALNVLAALFLSPLTSIALTMDRLQVAAGHLGRIADVMQAAPEIRSTGAARPRLAGGIELRDVTFSYRPDSAATLHGISMTVTPGQKVAIVGASGSGKTTLGLLMLGLVAPTSGAVLLDDRPLDQLDLVHVRRQFGVVLQEPSIFTGSIRHNLTIGNPNVSTSDLIAATRAAAIHDDVMSLPLGYDTYLTQSGGLSGGQRQRLAMARALLGRPRILLLDEATSHLDFANERRVNQAVDRLGMTRIIITHRLSTTMSADTVFVLDGGRIIEHGKPSELIAGDGPFAAMVQNLHRQTTPADPPSCADGEFAAETTRTPKPRRGGPVTRAW